MVTKNPSNPDTIVHLQVKPGHTALYQGKAFGDRATIQAPRRDAELLLKAGDVEQVEPDKVRDVGDLPTAARSPHEPVDFTLPGFVTSARSASPRPR